MDVIGWTFYGWIFSDGMFSAGRSPVGQDWFGAYFARADSIYPDMEARIPKLVCSCAGHFSRVRQFSRAKAELVLLPGSVPGKIWPRKG